MDRTSLLVRGAFAVTLAGAFTPSLAADVFFAGDLRTDATVTSCGPNCVLGSSNSDGDYAQYAASVYSFAVTNTTSIQAITYSYGGGVSTNGTVVAPGGLEPYLSLFDGGGNFIASTYFGNTCPAGANSYSGNCYDVALDGGTLTPGTYQIAISAYANMSLAENNGPPAILADGFTNLGNLAPGEDLSYAFDVILPGDVSTPEPTTLRFAFGAAALFAVYRKNYRNQAKLRT